METKQRFEMSEAQLAKIMDACRPVPYMVFGSMEPRSPQERANIAWTNLGAEMGFDSATVEPCGEGDRVFMAVPVVDQST